MISYYAHYIKEHFVTVFFPAKNNMVKIKSDMSLLHQCLGHKITFYSHIKVRRSIADIRIVDFLRIGVKLYTMFMSITGDVWIKTGSYNPITLSTVYR